MQRVLTSSMAAFALPPELFDMIFDEIRRDNDKHTLLSCSLVSRDWADLTLRHRFHTVALVLRPDLGKTDATAASFIQFFTADPAIQRAVRSLKLQWGQLGECAVSSTPFAVLHALPRLRTLEIAGVLRTPCTLPPAPASMDMGPHAPRSLACVTVRGLGADLPQLSHDPAALCHLLSQLGPLDELRLQDTALRATAESWARVHGAGAGGQDAEGGAAEAGVPPLRVGALTVSRPVCTDWLTQFLPWVARAGALRSLDIDSALFLEGRRAVKRVMKAIPGDVEHFSSRIPFLPESQSGERPESRRLRDACLLICCVSSMQKTRTSTFRPCVRAQSRWSCSCLRCALALTSGSVFRRHSQHSARHSRVLK